MSGYGNLCLTSHKVISNPLVVHGLFAQRIAGAAKGIYHPTYLSRYCLPALQWLALRSLRVISLESNRISKVRKDLLNRMESLEMLLLQGNVLNFIPHDAFANMHQLR